MTNIFIINYRHFNQRLTSYKKKIFILTSESRPSRTLIDTPALDLLGLLEMIAKPLNVPPVVPQSLKVTFKRDHLR